MRYAGALGLVARAMLVAGVFAACLATAGTAAAQVSGRLPRPGAASGIPYEFKPDVPATQPQEFDVPANQEIVIYSRERFLVPRRHSPFVAVGSWEARDSVLALWDIRKWRKGTVINGPLPLKKPLLTEDGQWLVDVSSDYQGLTLRAFPFKPNPAPVRYNPPMPLASAVLLGIREKELLVIVQPADAGTALAGHSFTRRKSKTSSSLNDLAPWVLAFDLPSGKLLRKYELPDPIAFGGTGTLSASGRFAAISSGTQVSLVEVDSGKLVAAIDLLPRPGSNQPYQSSGDEAVVRDLCYSPDGSMLAALVGADQRSYAYGHPSRLIIVATRDGSILVDNTPQIRARPYNWETGERGEHHRIEWSLDSNLLLLPGAVIEPLTGTQLQAVPENAYRFLNSRSILQSKSPDRYSYGMSDREEGVLSVFKLDSAKLAKTAAAVQEAGDLASTGLAALKEPDFAAMRETPAQVAPDARPMKIAGLRVPKYLGGVAVETPPVHVMHVVGHWNADSSGAPTSVMRMDAQQAGIAGVAGPEGTPAPPALLSRADAAAAVFSEAMVREAAAGALPVRCAAMLRMSLVSGRPTARVELPTVSKILAISPQADVAVVAPAVQGWDGRLDVWPLTHGATKPLVAFRPVRGKDLPRWVAMPDAATVLVLSGEGQLTAWRVPDLKPIWMISFRAAGAPTLTMDWRYLVLATPPTMSVIDLEAGKVVAAWDAPEAGDAYSVAINPDGTRVATHTPASQRVTVRSVPDGKRIGVVDLPYSVAWPVRWVTDGYLLLGDTWLLHPEKAAPIWRVAWRGERVIENAPRSMDVPALASLLESLPDGQLWALGMRSLQGTHGTPAQANAGGTQFFMVAVTVPDPAAASKIAEANAARLVVARAGDKLTVDFQMGGHACANVVTLADITQVLTKHGYQVAPNQRLKLVIRGTGRTMADMYAKYTMTGFMHNPNAQMVEGRAIDVSVSLMDGDTTVYAVRNTMTSGRIDYMVVPAGTFNDMLDNRVKQGVIEYIERLTVSPMRPPAPLQTLGASAPEFAGPKMVRNKWKAPRGATLRYVLNASEAQDRADLKRLDELEKPLAEASARFSGYAEANAADTSDPNRDETMRKEIGAFNAVVVKLPRETPGATEPTTASLKRFRESIVTLARLARQGADANPSAGNRLRRMAAGEAPAGGAGNPMIEELQAGFMPELDFLRERHATLREKYGK